MCLNQLVNYPLDSIGHCPVVHQPSHSVLLLPDNRELLVVAFLKNAPRLQQRESPDAYCKVLRPFLQDGGTISTPKHTCQIELAQHVSE